MVLGVALQAAWGPGLPAWRFHSSMRRLFPTPQVSLSLSLPQRRHCDLVTPVRAENPLLFSVSR